MISRRLALALVLAALGSGAAVAGDAGWTTALTKERRLRTQLAAELLDWVGLEGRRQADGPTSEDQALAAVRARYPQLSGQDAGTLAFLVLMTAARDVEADIRIPNPPVMVMDELHGRRGRLRAILAVLAPRTSPKVSSRLRALR